jgi:REJ domain
MKNGQSLPPPRIDNCIFDNNGGYVTISFAAPTDQAGITDLYWGCDRLFTFAANNQTLCSWTSNKAVKGIFSKIIPTSLKPGDPISINPGILRAACRAGTFCEANQYAQVEIDFDVTVVRHTVAVLPPAVPLVPALVLSIASQLGGCNDLSVDLSASEGTGGRHWSSVVFTVMSTNGRDLINTAAVTSYLNANFSYSSNHANVPRAMLGSETYSITALATNFLGNSASQTASVEVMSDSNLPVVSILGGLTRSIKSLSALLVEGRATLSNCATSQTLRYNFTLYNSTGGALTSMSTNIDPRKYSAPAYYFVVGNTYTITLRVELISETTQRTLSTGYTNLQLYIEHGVVKAAVRLGYFRQVLIGEVLIMDASISSDEDSSSGSTNLLFAWTCAIGSEIGFGLPCVFSQTALISYDSSVFSLPANQLQLNILYRFTVTVRSKDGRSAYQTVEISGLLAGSPIVVSYNTALKFSLDRPLVIPGSLTANVSTLATWTAVSYGYPASLERAYTQTSRTFTASQLRNTINYPLAILPYSFIGGRIYTFRLTASSVLFPSQISVTAVTMTANSPPIGGYLLVTPVTGYALDTLYSMITAGWSDDFADYPLSYNFAYELAVSNFIPALALTVNSPLPYAKSALPPGLQGGMVLR